MTSGDWLPAQAPFDLVRRGFAPEQVTAHLERLEYDLRITTANRDATNQRLTELGAQLAAAQAEADALRAQLDRSALEPVSMANLSDRMQRMIRLAEEEASEIRARAEADADRLRGQLETSIAEAAEARAAFDAERERTRKQLAEQVHGLIAEASSEAEETKSAAQDEADRILQQANDEAQRTIAEARAQAGHLMEVAHGTAEQELAHARAEAERVTTEAIAAADELTRNTAAERERLDAESLARRTQIDEDFEIAIAAKRLEANRIITERDEGSAAAAEQLVADARAHAEQLVATATAESDKLMRQATTYANALVNRATAESHQRVADADAAVSALETLRAQLTEQLTSLTGHLDHIRELAASAPALLVPPPAEQGRPVSTDFPADPAARPTSTELHVPVYGEEEAGSENPAVADPEAEAVTKDVEPAVADTTQQLPVYDATQTDVFGPTERDLAILRDPSDLAGGPTRQDDTARELNRVGAAPERSGRQRIAGQSGKRR
jgi:cell division septum initiation protein DivIVA